jgi:hypothetical protein
MPTTAPIGRRHQAARRKREPERQAELYREVRRRVRADRHERRVPDRDLAGIADDDVQSERADVATRIRLMTEM